MLEYELRQKAIIDERVKDYQVYYKDTIFKPNFFADFVVFDEIILEENSTKSIPDDFIAMGLNYLKVSENKVGLIVNFGRQSLEWKRIVY